MKTSTLWTLTALLLILLMSLALALTEGILRVLSVRESEESRDHVVETPYLPVKLRPSYRGVIWGLPFSTNRYGHRGEVDFPRQPPSGELRILSLGDSIGFGLGIAAEDHYTKVLERRLNDPSSELGRAADRFHVINAGGQGYSPSGYYVYLKHEGLQFEPRLVLVEIELCNDITDEALLHWQTGAAGLPEAVVGGRYVVAWDGNLLGTYARGGYFFEKTYTYTVFVRRLLNLCYRLSPTEPFYSTPGGGIYYSLGFDRYLLTESRLEAGWEKMFRVLGATRDLLAQRGIGFLLMIMPSRYLYEDAGPWTQKASELVQRAESRARQENLPYLNLKEAVQQGGGAGLFFDFAHLTEEGNRVVGEALFLHLQTLSRGASL